MNFDLEFGLAMQNVSEIARPFEFFIFVESTVRAIMPVMPRLRTNYLLSLALLLTAYVSLVAQWASGQEPKKIHPGDQCPGSTGSHPTGLSNSSVFCASCLWFGTRPAYFAWAFQLGNGDQAVFELTGVRHDRSGYSAKTPWVTSPGFSGRITISGRQLDSNGTLRFSVDGAKAEKKLILTAPNRATAADQWSFWPADMVIPRAGCYAIRIETSGRIEYVVFNTITGTH